MERKMMLWWFSMLSTVLFVEVAVGFNVGFPVISESVGGGAFLSPNHYLRTCPDAEGIINQVVTSLVNKDKTLAAAIIRLHFHDCAIRGCDASILLNHTGSERAAKASKTLRGFQIIDDIKGALEKKCPKTVSCADILTIAARDATVLVGGPFWEVPMGRRDGRVSISKEAESVPQGRENITALIKFFAARGLDVLDLVTLSGAHTIGRSTCQPIQHRLITKKPDPTLNVGYSKMLRNKCTKQSNYVHLDGTTPRTFDEVYFKNLGKKMGLLSTDQALYNDARTKPFVETMANQPFIFTNQFVTSMVKLGNVQVLTKRSEGEIRLKCSSINYR